MAIAGKLHADYREVYKSNTNAHTGSISPNMPTIAKTTNDKDGARSHPPRRKSHGTSRGRGLYSGGKSRFLSDLEGCMSLRLRFTSLLPTYYTLCILAVAWCNTFFFIPHRGNLSRGQAWCLLADLVLIMSLIRVDVVQSWKGFVTVSGWRS